MDLLRLLLGGNPLTTLKDGLLQAQKQWADAKNNTERLQAEQNIAFWQAQIADGAERASVVKAGMQHRIFWVAWGMAAIPLAFWFGWGILDSAIADGSVLPDVATLPPQLKAYADVVWENIFYSGAVLGVGTAIAGAISRTRK
jgi:hypothetical protein